MLGEGSTAVVMYLFAQRFLAHIPTNKAAAPSTADTITAASRLLPRDATSPNAAAACRCRCNLHPDFFWHPDPSFYQ